MTVQELIEYLEGFDGDAEVKLAQQPSWPFEYSIGAIEEVPQGDDTSILYIAEANQLGYLPQEACELLGW